MARPGRFTHQGEEIKCGMGGGFSDGSSQKSLQLLRYPFHCTFLPHLQRHRLARLESGPHHPLAPDRDKIEPRREFLGAGVAE